MEPKFSAVDQLTRPFDTQHASSHLQTFEIKALRRSRQNIAFHNRFLAFWQKDTKKVRRLKLAAGYVHAHVEPSHGGVAPQIASLLDAQEVDGPQPMVSSPSGVWRYSGPWNIVYIHNAPAARAQTSCKGVQHLVLTLRERKGNEEAKRLKSSLQVQERHVRL